MSDEITLQERFKEIEAQLIALSETLSTMNTQVREWIAKRDLLNQEKIKLGDNVHHHRSKRDQLNKKVQELKSTRADLYTRLKVKLQDYHESRQQRTLYKTLNQSEAEIRHQIEILEWKIQTTVQSIPQEKEIINQIKTLEQQAIIHRKRAKFTDQMTQLRHTINELKSKIGQINQQITAIAQESQKHHATMNEKITQRNQKRSEADQAHQHYLEAMQTIRQHEKEHRILNNELRELSQRLKRDRKEKLNTNLESQRDIAITKLNEKKKISFEEYKVLKEKGLI